MNSLITACNQSSNRHPVVHYDQPIVNGALKSTRQQGSSQMLSKAGARVPKFAECLCENLNLNDSQAAVLAELILRGPQTPGELRQRTSRMHKFTDLASVEIVLRAMEDRGLVTELPRQAGKRETRFAQLLSGPVEVNEESIAPPSRSSLEQRVEVLEAQMAEVLARLSGS